MFKQEKIFIDSSPLKPWRLASTCAVIVDTKKQSQAPTFEQALEQLEGIVESMESGNTPLADLLVKFEEGTKLLKICEARLKEAEVKIELLKKQKGGDPAFADFPVSERE